MNDLEHFKSFCISERKPFAAVTFSIFSLQWQFLTSDLLLFLLFDGADSDFLREVLTTSFKELYLKFCFLFLILQDQ